jgi:acyl-CoA thioesterase-1
MVNFSAYYPTVNKYILRSGLIVACFAALILISACGDNSGQHAVPTDAAHALSPNPGPDTMARLKSRTIVFFGNSLTAGFGVEPSQAFPALIQDRLDSLRLPYQVVNAGVSGETSAGGNSRVDWVLHQRVDVFVLELGANDGLRGLPLADTKKNLQAIIDKVKQKYPSAKIVLAGMRIPPNMGNDYASGFSSIFKQLAAENRIALIPFLLEGVGGVADLNQADGIHPTAEGHRIVAETVWKTLKQEL